MAKRDGLALVVIQELDNDKILPYKFKIIHRDHTEEFEVNPLDFEEKRDALKLGFFNEGWDWVRDYELDNITSSYFERTLKE